MNIIAETPTLTLCLRDSCYSSMPSSLIKISELERKTGLDVFVDMSVSETLYHLIVVGATQPGGGHGRDGLMAEASTLQKRLKIPDKRFWHIKIKVRSIPYDAVVVTFSSLFSCVV